ncbi:MAG TPA: aminotransferase class IV [Gemmatales bacterium]|nr:aminotransferase class IV [Gemmatales bacterium]
MPAPLANLNGIIQPLATAMVPALDRGFLFGDAVYEGIYACDGKPRFLDLHLKRLERSLRELRIGPIQLERLQQRLLETLAAGPFDEAFIYIQISRGAGASRTHHFPPPGTPPTEFFFIEEFTDPYGELRHTGVSAITQPDIRWHRCDVKSVNLLGNVLAFQAAKEQNAREAILVRPDGTITEGTRTSLFGVVDGTLRTGPLSAEILPGVTRSVHVDELPQVQELFLTGTTSEVLPVTILDGKPVADGQPGPITRKLQRAFAELVRK